MHSSCSPRIQCLTTDNPKVCDYSISFNPMRKYLPGHGASFPVGAQVVMLETSTGMGHFSLLRNTVLALLSRQKSKNLFKFLLKALPSCVLVLVSVTSVQRKFEERSCIPSCVAPDSWNAERCSEVAFREDGGSGTPARTHLSKLLSAETLGPVVGFRLCCSKLCKREGKKIVL